MWIKQRNPIKQLGSLAGPCLNDPPYALSSATMLIDPILTDDSILVDVGVERWLSLTLVGNPWTSNRICGSRSYFRSHSFAPR